MSPRGRSLFWGVMAVIPWLWLLFVILFVFIFDLMPGIEAQSFLGKNWYLLSIIAMMIIWVMFIYHVKRNPFVPEDKRQLWTWLIVIGNIYVYPVYWWHYVRDNA